MQKRDFIEQMAPWLVWTMFFCVLAIVGGHYGNVGATTTNPRALTQVQAPLQQSTNDCRGETLQLKGEKIEKR